MSNSKVIKRYAIYGSIAVIASLGTLLAVRARAAGVPETDALTYTGYLEDAEGQPLTGDHSIEVHFWESEEATEDLCTGKLDTVALQAGRFQVPLPAACVDAVNGGPDIWVDVEVDGGSLGRTKLGAVPYALEAGHATAADEATHATTAANAPVVTEWQAFDSTVISGNSALAGATVAARYRRVGDTLEVRSETSLGVGTAGNGLDWTLPEGLSIDFAKHTTGQDTIGYGRTNIAGQDEAVSVTTSSADPTIIRVLRHNGANWAGATAAGQYIHLTFTIPIVGWSALE